MSDLPVILKCPRGEEWPATSFDCLVAKKRVQTHETVTFFCPLGHTFTLKTAVEKGMFTPIQAIQMIAAAQRNLPALIKEGRRVMRRWRKQSKGKP